MNPITYDQFLLVSDANISNIHHHHHPSAGYEIKASYWYYWHFFHGRSVLWNQWRDAAVSRWGSRVKTQLTHQRMFPSLSARFHFGRLSASARRFSLFWVVFWYASMPYLESWVWPSTAYVSVLFAGWFSQSSCACIGVSVSCLQDLGV